jgi:16S rRNA A1518/A1519 N6-dimethyltransferase RsmA/KsgA/DIM1 with predicted DNA glycosylase/AP lyase activity
MLVCCSTMKQSYDRLMGAGITPGIYDPTTFTPNSAIGQHILLDPEVIQTASELIPERANVIEIGAGPGTLTGSLLARGRRVTAYEIDKRCAPMLDELASETQRLAVRWEDFIKVPNEDVEAHSPYHLAGNIPFHISEPLLWKMTNLHFSSAVFFVGRRLVESMTTLNPDQSSWNQFSLIAGAYFDVSDVVRIPRISFDPPPRVDAGLIQVTRKDADESQSWRSNAVTRSYRALIEAKSTNSTVAKALKSVVVKPNGDAETGARHRNANRRSERRIARTALNGVVADYNAGYLRAENSSDRASLDMHHIVSQTVDERLLSKPLAGLSNKELARICSAVSTAVNRRKKIR